MFEHLPTEIFETIVSFLNNEETLWACRNVSRRWNEVSVRHWRKRFSRRPIFDTAQSMRDFILEGESRIQDFPFSRIGFRCLNSGNIATAKHLINLYSKYIIDIDIRDVTCDAGICHNFEALLECFENIKELRFSITTNNWPNLSIHHVNFTNLQVLRLPITRMPFDELPASIIQSALNLRLLEAQFLPRFMHGERKVSVWPFTLEYRRISQIQLKLHLWFPDSSRLAIEKFIKFAEKLGKWDNIQITELTITMTKGVLRPHQVNVVKLKINEILRNHANNIKHLQTFGTLRDTVPFSGVSIWIPEMQNLAGINLDFGKGNLNPVRPISGNTFASLQSVTLTNFEQPSQVFQPAVLESVKTFRLYDAGAKYIHSCSRENYTAFHNVFPNLINFTYVNSSSGKILNIDHFGYIVETLRMESLENVKYVLGNNHLYIKNIFAGLHDVTKKMKEADEAFAKGGNKAEDKYWAQIKDQRSPCLVNMKGLKTFHLDVPIDDTFARAVLLRMKPLSRLTVCSTKVSFNIFCKLIEVHTTVCPLQDDL